LLLKQPINCGDNFGNFLAGNFEACLPIIVFGDLPFGSVKFLFFLIACERGQLIFFNFIEKWSRSKYELPLVLTALFEQVSVEPIVEDILKLRELLHHDGFEVFE
jgi:hypothetical protein